MAPNQKQPDGHIEVVESGDWYIGYKWENGRRTELTIGPPPQNARFLSGWIGTLTGDDLDAAIQMLTDMWTFKRGSRFDRYCLNELLRERFLRENNSSHSARVQEYHRLMESVERANVEVFRHAWQRDDDEAFD